MQELKRLRKERDWSQVRLAKESGIDRATINQVEGGHRSPTIETLEKLAMAMGAEVADFFPKAEPSLFDAVEQRRRWRNPNATEARRIAEEINLPPSLDSLNIVDVMRDVVDADRRRGERQITRAVESGESQTNYGSVVGEFEHRMEDQLGWAFGGFMYSGLLNGVRRILDLEEENARLKKEVETAQERAANV